MPVFLVALILTLFAVSLPIIIFSMHRVFYSQNAAKKSDQKKPLEPGSGSEKKKKKKRVKKKTQEETHSGGVDGKEEKKKDSFPFTSSSSTMQKKLRNQYDQLVKSYESSHLDLVQVSEFVDCLVDAKKDLKHRSHVLKRKFTVARALLQNADRSSYNRLHNQVCKLEVEIKRLDEDILVFNWLHQQLKVSPAYMKILEIGATIEMADKLRVREDDGKEEDGMEEDGNNDDDFANISFEELLEQEKKDAFWQKHKNTRSN